MEVNDRPNGMEVAGAKHDQGFLWLINLRSQWLFTGVCSFFNELECSILCLFFNEHELCAKTARISLFYFLTSINSAVKLLDIPSIR